MPLKSVDPLFGCLFQETYKTLPNTSNSDQIYNLGKLSERG